MAGRRPDYTLSAMDKGNDALKGSVGVAWINEDGSISVRLNPFVVLDTRQHSLELRLFKNDRETATPATKKPKTDHLKYVESEDEIPF